MNQNTDTPFRIDVAEAEQLIDDHMPSFGAERLPLSAAAGQILAEPVIAERDQPPFNRATMDGIAVAATELVAGRRRFRASGTQAAGAPQQSLPAADCCMEVMTGAIMPAGADTVVPVERITHSGDEFEIEAGYNVAETQFVHLRGSDHREGDVLMRPGVRITGPEMAILTAAGQAEIAVSAWPEIAIVSTGDELVDVGEPIATQQIRSSNDRAIEATLQLRGCGRTRRTRLPDDRDALLQEIGRLHDECGVLILSGGVSMGKYDYIPAVLTELGVNIVFHKILQRPGLPMWFGISGAGKPVLALPGNPVSTLVCLVRYVIPALQRSLNYEPRPEQAKLAEDIEFAPDLCWFLPVRLDDEGSQARPRPTNTSGDFIGLRNTDGFIELPRGRSVYSAGESFRLWRW